MVVLPRHLPLVDSGAVSSCGLDIRCDLALLAAVQMSFSLMSPVEVVRMMMSRSDFRPAGSSADFLLRFFLRWLLYQSLCRGEVHS